MSHLLFPLRATRCVPPDNARVADQPAVAAADFAGTRTISLLSPSFPFLLFFHFPFSFPFFSFSFPLSPSSLSPSLPRAAEQPLTPRSPRPLPARPSRVRLTSL